MLTISKPEALQGSFFHRAQSDVLTDGYRYQIKQLKLYMNIINYLMRPEDYDDVPRNKTIKYKLIPLLNSKVPLSKNKIKELKNLFQMFERYYPIENLLNLTPTSEKLDQMVRKLLFIKNLTGPATPRSQKIHLYKTGKDIAEYSKYFGDLYFTDKINCLDLRCNNFKMTLWGVDKFFESFSKLETLVVSDLDPQIQENKTWGKLKKLDVRNLNANAFNFKFFPKLEIFRLTLSHDIRGLKLKFKNNVFNKFHLYGGKSAPTLDLNFINTSIEELIIDNFTIRYNINFDGVENLKLLILNNCQKFFTHQLNFSLKENKTIKTLYITGIDPLNFPEMDHLPNLVCFVLKKNIPDIGKNLDHLLKIYPNLKNFGLVHCFEDQESCKNAMEPFGMIEKLEERQIKFLYEKSFEELGL